jgi:hypothetical protein
MAAERTRETAQAQANGIRGTGIGCFFDDLTHRVFGLTGDRFQVLYHFTMGGPLDDPRLQTHPPYDHLAVSVDAERLGGYDGVGPLPKSVIH